jgi:ligand-binding sensor domain-containing protein/uncharacterized coiled-coil protein SlyX
MRWICLSVLVALLGPLPGQAQTFFYNQYRTTQGLPADEVRTVTRDSIGFLWVATDNGLARFDGRGFTTYQAQIESRYVKAFAHGPGGKILLANDAGVFAIEPKIDTASVRRVIPAHPQPTDSTVVYPNGLHYDTRGTLWISQPNGSVTRTQEGTLRRFSFGKDHTTGTSESGFFFANDAQGRLWMAASTGQLYRYRPEAERFQRVKLPRKPERVHDLHIQNDTLRLVGTQFMEAQILAAGHLENVQSFSTGGRTLTHLAIDTEGLLLGTEQSGLFRGERQGDDLVMQKVFGANDPHRVEQLPFDGINHIYVAPDGPLWLSSNQGLGLLQSRFFTGVSGLTPNNTLSVYPDDDRVLVSFGDVYAVRSRERQPSSVQLLPVSEQNLITSLASVGDTLWMGSANGRVLASTDDRTAQTLDYSDRGSSIFYMLGDQQGNLWFCQAPEDQPLKGVSKIAPDGTMTFYGADRGIENRILVLEEAPNGALYAAGIGPDTYLFRYQPDRDRFINLSLPLSFPPSQNFEVHDLAVGERGIVWLATTDGLLRYDLNQIERVDLDQFTETEIRSVEILPDGSVWLATDTQGLLHYRNDSIVQFAVDAGLPTTVMVYRTLRADSRGHLWIGTAEGAVHSRKRQPTPRPTPSPQLVSTQFDGSRAKAPDQLSVRAGTPVTLRFAALTFPAGDLTYQYRITGAIDTSWSEPRIDNSLTLRRLPLGEYSLEIRAKKGSGYYWSAPLRLPVDVHPVWYRTWWTYALFGLLGISALGYGGWHYVTRRRERIAELETTLDEREQILEEQERALEQQREAIEEKTEELAATEAHLDALHHLIQHLPPSATWPDVMEVLSDMVEEVESIDAIEFGYYHEDEMHFDGYHLNQDEYVHRREDFDDRTKVPVWSLFHDEPVHIDEFGREHTRYVHSADAERAPSLLCLPFDLPGLQHLVLVVYGSAPYAFRENDRMMAELLVDYLAAVLREPLDPTSKASPYAS